MRLPRPLVLAAALVVVAAPAFADEFREGKVVLKEGKTLVGKIDDRGTVVIVIVRGTKIETEIPRDKVKEVIYDNPDETTTKRKKTWLRVETDDGNVVKGEGREEGDDIVIITKVGSTRAETRIKRARVVKTEIIPAEGDDDEGPQDTGPELERWVDHDARFLLERPGPDWKLARKGFAPLVRATMTHAEKDAFVRVTVRPAAAQPYGEPNRDSCYRLSREIGDNELRRDFDRMNGPGINVADFCGGKVYEVRYSGLLPCDKTEYEYLEYRFERNGFVYQLTGGAERKIFSDFQPQLRRALEGFSFIANADLDPEGYADLNLGFYVCRPGPTWNLLARPFDEKAPVEVRNADGRGVLRLNVVDAPSGKTPREATEEHLKARLKLNKELQIKSVERLGVKLELFSFSGFEQGQGKLREYVGVTSVVGKKLLILIGEASANDADSAQLVRDLQGAVDRAVFIDPASSAERMKKATDAARAMSEGFDAYRKNNPAGAAQRYSDAIALHEGFARAYYLRAVANEAMKKWTELRADLDAAIKLDPRPDYQAAQARSHAQEGQDLLKENKWPEAESALRRAYLLDKTNDKIKRDIVENYKRWFNDLKGKNNIPQAAQLLDKVDSSGLDREKDVAQFLADSYCEVGEKILGQDKKKYSQAEGYAKKALRTIKGFERANRLQRACDDAEKALNKGKR